MNAKKYMYAMILLLVVAVVSSTLALVYFRSEVTSVTLKVTEELGAFINYKNGTPVLGGPEDILNLGTSYQSGISTEIEFWKTEDARNMDIYGHIYIDMDMVSDALAEDPGLKWAVETNGILISEGDFTNYKQGDSVPILINQKLLPQQTKYKIYIWLDENAIVSSDFTGETFTLTVRCEATSGEYSSFSSFGEIGEFDYTGSIQTLPITKNGTYKLEVWGAQGGFALNETYRGGYGGYSSGVLNLNNGDTLYIGVGGRGGDGTAKVNTLNPGGYNGGGNTYGATNKYTGSAGGATHIALADGLLNTLSSNIDDILIVAGGGGASSYYQETSWNLGGNGGGIIGNDGTQSSSTSAYGTGGTQTSGGTGYINGLFGQGANATAESIGGGGGFYGGGAGRYNSSGGGGSGYIGNPLLTNKAMYCYGCATSEEVETLTYDVTDISEANVSEVPISEYAKMGNGYARISLVIIGMLSRKTITYGTNYDFKVEAGKELGSNYDVIYSTYENVNTLSIGEYQIMFIVKDNTTDTNIHTIRK